MENGGANISGPQSFRIAINPVNDPPAITFHGPNTPYRPGSLPDVIDVNAEVTDIDSPDFDGGALTVEITTNQDPQDSVGIAHVGSGGSEVNLFGNVVYCGGQAIGQVASGLHTPTIVVTASRS